MAKKDETAAGPNPGDMEKPSPKPAPAQDTTESMGPMPEPGNLPDPTAGAPEPPAAEPKRGRGRPKGSSTKAKPTLKAKEAELLAQASAETIVGGLDILRHVISAGEAPEAPGMRKECVMAWTIYCKETGKGIPAWALVAMTSAAYVMPALTTPPAKSFFGGMWAKAKGWWAMRKA